MHEDQPRRPHESHRRDLESREAIHLPSESVVGHLHAVHTVEGLLLAPGGQPEIGFDIQCLRYELPNQGGHNHNDAATTGVFFDNGHGEFARVAFFGANGLLFLWCGRRTAGLQFFRFFVLQIVAIVNVSFILLFVQ
jgi:hypothetical protein